MKFALLLTPHAPAPLCTFRAYTPRDLCEALSRRIIDDRTYYPAVFSEAIDSLDRSTLTPWLLLSRLPQGQNVRGTVVLRGAARTECTETACAHLMELARAAVAHGEAVARFLRQAGCVVEDAML